MAVGIIELLVLAVLLVLDLYAYQKYRESRFALQTVVHDKRFHHAGQEAQSHSIFVDASTVTDTVQEAQDDEGQAQRLAEVESKAISQHQDHEHRLSLVEKNTGQLQANASQGERHDEAIEQMAKELTQSRGATDKRMSFIETGLSEVKSDTTAILERLDQGEHARKATEARVTGVEKKLDEVTTSVDERWSAFEQGLEKEKASNEQRVTRVETGLEEVSSESKRLDKSLSELSKEMKKHEDSPRAQQEMLDKLSTIEELAEDRFAEVDRKVEKLSFMEQKVQAISSLEKRVDEITALSSKLDDTTTQVEQLKEKLGKMPIESDDGKQALEEAKKANAHLSTHVEDAIKLQKLLDERLDEIEDKVEFMFDESPLPQSTGGKTVSKEKETIIEKEIVATMEKERISTKEKLDKERKALRDLHDRLLAVEKELAMHKGEVDVTNRAVDEKIATVSEKADKSAATALVESKSIITKVNIEAKKTRKAVNTAKTQARKAVTTAKIQAAKTAKVQARLEARKQVAKTTNTVVKKAGSKKTTTAKASIKSKTPATRTVKTTTVTKTLAKKISKRKPTKPKARKAAVKHKQAKTNTSGSSAKRSSKTRTVKTTTTQNNAQTLVTVQTNVPTEVVEVRETQNK